MRDYRGLTKNGKWVYGWYCEVLGYHFIIPNDADIVGVKPPNTYGLIGSIEVIPESVGQQTGRKDKKGKETYKGDIICYPNDYSGGSHIDFSPPEPNNDIGEIYYDEKQAAFCVRSNAESSREPIDMPFGQFIDEYGEFEIIGSIHTTPELMEQDR